MPALPLRRPFVAGRFYPAQPEVLARDVDGYLAPEPVTKKTAASPAIACVSPHAGYMYSGRVAGAVFRRLAANYASYVIAGPNHFGRGHASLAIMSAGAWMTPLGEVPIDTQLAGAISRACTLVEEDPVAHQQEHSIEVQVPFLQRTAHDFGIVPIAIGLAGYEELASLGHALAEALGQAQKPVLLVASSDMNHYEPDDVTRIKDSRAIDRILALDPRGLYEVVKREQISMCGLGPAVAVLVASKELGATQAELVKYATSADAGGERDAVVGYAGLIIS